MPWLKGGSSIARKLYARICARLTTTSHSSPINEGSPDSTKRETQLRELYTLTFEVTIIAHCHTTLEARCVIQNIARRAIDDAARADGRVRTVRMSHARVTSPTREARPEAGSARDLAKGEV